MTCKLKLSDGPHNMDSHCLEFYGIPRDFRNFVCGLILNKWKDSEDYKYMRDASPVVQCDSYFYGGTISQSGWHLEDDPESYLLIEFWVHENDNVLLRAVIYLEQEIDKSGFVFDSRWQEIPDR